MRTASQSSNPTGSIRNRSAARAKTFVSNLQILAHADVEDIVQDQGLSMPSDRLPRGRAPVQAQRFLHRHTSRNKQQCRSRGLTANSSHTYSEHVIWDFDLLSESPNPRNHPPNNLNSYCSEKCPDEYRHDSLVIFRLLGRQRGYIKIHHSPIDRCRKILYPEISNKHPDNPDTSSFPTFAGYQLIYSQSSHFGVCFPGTNDDVPAATFPDKEPARPGTGFATLGCKMAGIAGL
ncbi:hypothetical protein DRA46_01852 [Burkholderia gladioli]|nr:hypothetical protein [Burkholderia gladioli]